MNWRGFDESGDAKKEVLRNVESVEIRELKRADEY